MDQTLLKLHQLGFSEYEAKAYITLLKNSPVTGYELSKNSGVPRSMIYQTLQRLIDKGAALSIMGQPIKYIPTNAQELLGRLRYNYNTLVDDLDEKLSQLSQVVDYSYFWNLKGYNAIIDKTKQLIADTKETLYLSVCKEELVHLETQLLELHQRGCKIEILCRGEADLPIPNIYPAPQRSDEDRNLGRWLTVISDLNVVLISEGLQAKDCIAVWTQNASLITISLRYIKYEMFIAQKFNQLPNWE